MLKDYNKPLIKISFNRRLRKKKKKIRNDFKIITI